MKRGRPTNPLEHAPTGELYQGSQIRVLRDQSGLSVEELAALVGRHSRALAKIETNGAKASEQLLQKIADHVGTSLDQLKRSPLGPKILEKQPLQQRAAQASLSGTPTVSAAPQTTSSSKDKNIDELVLAKLDAIEGRLEALEQAVQRFELIGRSERTVVRRTPQPMTHVLVQLVAEIPVLQQVAVQIREVGFSTPPEVPPGTSYALLESALEASLTEPDELGKHIKEEVVQSKQLYLRGKLNQAGVERAKLSPGAK